MISGMNYWSRENPPPASFFVISGVKALLSALEDFHNRNYNIFVAHPDGYSPADLVPTASCLWDFKSFIHNGPPYHPRTEMLPHSIKDVQDQRSCLNYPLLTMQEHLLEITEEKIPARLQIKIDRSCQGSGVQSLLLLLLHKKLRNERFIPTNIMRTGLWSAYEREICRYEQVNSMIQHRITFFFLKSELTGLFLVRSVFASSDELIPQKKVPTLVLWDMRSCPLPEGRKCRYIVDNIPSAVLRNSSCSRIIMLAFTDDNIPDSIARLLTGMSLIFTLPYTPAESMIFKMNDWAERTPAPANYLVISGDDALTTTLNNLHSRNYNILAAHPHCGVHSDLVATASCVWDFPSLIRGGPPYNVRKNMVPRCSFDFSKLSLKDVGKCQT